MSAMRIRLSSLAFVLVTCAASSFGATAAQDTPKTDKPKRSVNPDLLLEGEPEVFQSLAERSNDLRLNKELLDLFTEARSLEERHLLREALRTLERARAKAPDQPAILRRIVRLNFATGNPDKALQIGKTLLKAEPNDSSTLALLVALLIERRNDATGAETLLQDVLANPKLEPRSIARWLAHRSLGEIYFELLNQPEKAADQFEALIAGLDGVPAGSLSEIDQRRLLDENPADAYLRFGQALLQAKRYEGALRAFQHGLSYDQSHALLPYKVAEAQFRMGKQTEALATLERYLDRKPQGREPYELLGEILTSLGRGAEFKERLQKAADADPENLHVQFALVELLRALGQKDEAEVRLRTLISSRADPQVYSVLTAALIKDRKPRELLYLFKQASTRSGAIDAVVPHIDSLAADEPLSRDVLTQAIDLARAEPTVLTREMRAALAVLADKIHWYEPLVPLDRIALAEAKTTENYDILYFDQMRAGQFSDAAQALTARFAERPDERNAPRVKELARASFLAGNYEESLDAAREAVRLDGTDFEAQVFVPMILSRLSKNAEAFAEFEEILKRFPNNDQAEREVLARRSALHVELGDITKGEADLETLLAKEPDDPGINNDLGYLYADQNKNLERAEQMIRKAIDEDPLNSSFLDSLGWVLYRRGKFTDALVPLEQAALDPSVQSTIFDHLGDVYFQLQRYDDANKAWTKAVQIATKASPPDKRLDPLRRKLEELDALRSSGLPSRPSDP